MVPYVSTAHPDDTVDDCAIASDGCYLYVLNKKGLLKMGSGYGGTIKVTMCKKCACVSDFDVR